MSLRSEYTDQEHGMPHTLWEVMWCYFTSLFNSQDQNEEETSLAFNFVKHSRTSFCKYNAKTEFVPALNRENIRIKI